MALHDDPPHRVDTYTLTTSTDAGGGVVQNFALAQSALPCSIDTATADEQERFARMQQVVTHKVGILTSKLTTALTPGMKLVTTDRAETYHVKGLAGGRAYGTIPAFTYAFCEQLL